MGEMCNDCYLAMQNCHDMSICCEMEEYDGDKCDWFEPKPEQGDEGMLRGLISIAGTIAGIILGFILGQLGR